jgi:chemosensory pili system protein ChpC
MSLFFLDKQNPVEKIDCLAVNIGKSQLLIPMPAVAEIIHSQNPTHSQQLPEWVAGWIDWRHLNIPLIDFAAMQAQSAADSFGTATRILVLNSCAEGHSHRYYAIMTNGFPHTLSVEESTELKGQPPEAVNTCIKINLTINSSSYALPDFQAIEALLQKIPLYY